MPLQVIGCVLYWRASETLYRGNKLRIRDIILFVHMSFCTLTLPYFCVSSVVDPVPYSTKQDPLVYRSLPVIEVFTVLDSFAGAVNTYKITGFYFLFKFVVVIS